MVSLHLAFLYRSRAPLWAAACVGRASCSLGVNCKVCAHASHDDEQHKERLIQLVENANQLHLNGDLLHVSDASAEEKGVVR